MSLADDTQKFCDDTLFYRISSRFRMARLMRGFLCKDIARLAGCSTSMLSKIENGKVLPAIPMLVRIATALDVSMAWMLDEGESLIPTVHSIGIEGVPTKVERRKQRLVEDMTASDKHPFVIRMLAAKGGTDFCQLKDHSGESTFAITRGVLQVHCGDASVLACAGRSFHLQRSETYGFTNGSNADLAVTIFSRPVLSYGTAA